MKPPTLSNTILLSNVRYLSSYSTVQLTASIAQFTMQKKKSLAAEWRLYTFSFPYPLKNNFPLYDLHCVATLRIQNYVDLKALIRSTAPQTEQHSQSTVPLDKMPQCRMMSNVLQRRLVTVCRLTGSFIGCYKYDERQDNQSKMVFGSFFFGKWG